MSSSLAKPDRYHHGDLRRALLAYSLRRLRRGALEGFSLREAARALGVSSGAVYNHFADREELLAAVAAEGFRLFARRIARAARGLSREAKLRAVGLSYVGFASAEPRLFRLMFSRAGVEAGAARIRAPADPPSTFEQLREALAEAAGVDAGAVDSSSLALAWSAAHGAASLICDGVWSRDDPRAREAIDAVVTMLASRRAVAARRP